MDKYDTFKDIYGRVRSYDAALDDLIKNCSSKMDELGDYVLYKDMGVSDEMIKTFVAFKEFEPWLEEMRSREDGSEDSEAPPTSEEDDSHSSDEYDNEFLVELEACGDVDCMMVEDADELYEKQDSDSNENKTASDTDEENLESKEASVAKKIRNICDAFGSEAARDLDKTAPNLLHLGRIYKSYANMNKDSSIEQKFNYIRASALINAALVRYEIIGDKIGCQNATDDLISLHCDLLDASTSVMKHEHFIEISRNMKQQIRLFRQQEVNTLSSITQLKKNLRNISSPQACERSYVKELRKLSTANSFNYEKVIRTIAEKCLEIMGEPPCNFAIVGLGSLARREITLSSDFEHIIIFDNAAVDTEELKEYFRWFTVIFHVIVIGLGETIIPSVDIKSLCDYYSKDDRMKWYKDVHTPCGISFDGMMPHACKCPLGRWKPTEKRDHVVELIQPASVMANYLTKQQEIKNGYLLHDVLGTSCFVYGDHEVYEAFVAGCTEVKAMSTPLEVFLQQRDILTNVIETWHVSRFTSAKYLTSMKKTLYRPLTVLLHVLAVHYNLSSQSSFDILDEMKQRAIIDEECHLVLCFAIAIVLEVRTRSNQTKHQQRNASGEEDVVKMIGSESLALIKVTILFLVYGVQEQMYSTFKLHQHRPKLAFPSTDGLLWQFEIIRSTPYLGNDLEIAQDFLLSIEETLSKHTKSKSVEVGQTYYRLKIHFELLSSLLDKITANDGYDKNNFKVLAHHKLREEYFWSAEIVMRFGTNPNNQITFLIEKAYVLFFENRYEEANTAVDCCVEACRAAGDVIVTDPTHDGVAELEMVVKSKCLNPHDAIEYFKSAPKRSFVVTCLHKIGIAKAHSRQNMKERSCEILSDVASDLVEFSHKVTPRVYGNLLSLIGSLLDEYGHRVSASEVVDLYYNTRDAMLPGSHIDSSQYTSFPSLKHYKYNFGYRWNVGKYSNFTFSYLKYEKPLAILVVDTKYYNALQLFSSVCYGDMISLVDYILADDLKFETLPKGSMKLRMTSQLLSLMALCEKVKPRDLDVFARYLNEMPLTYRKYKILQPFLYACLKEYEALPTDTEETVTKQNALLLQIFPPSRSDVTSNVQAKLRDEVLVSYTEFDFASCVEMTWKGLHWHFERSEPCSNNTLMEIFITGVFTIMVERKRQAPLPYLTKCRELSLKQALWLHCFYLDEAHREFLSCEFQYVSGFYELSSHRLALMYNLAVDFLVYDPRASVGLLWKIIHYSLMEDEFIDMAVILTFAALERICDLTLAFSNLPRIL